MRLIRNQRLVQAVVLAAILAVASVLRFVGLSGRGLIYWDEAKFALEGVRFHAYFLSLFDSHIATQAGKTIGTAKPTHALLIALAYTILGVHDYAPLFVNAFCSVVEVGLAFFVGRRLFGPWVGLIGALFLAVCEYDVIYARSALSESDADMLFLAAVLLWVIDWERIGIGVPKLKGRPTRMLLYCALLAGASFTANYRLIVYIFVLVAFDVAWTVNEFGWSAVRNRLFSWAAGLAALPVAWQVVDVIARAGGHVLFRSEVNVIVRSGRHIVFSNVREGGAEWYFAQVLFQLHGGKQSVIRFDPVLYLQWFVLREGWVIGLLVLVGLFLTLRTRLFPWFALAGLVAGPYAIYTFAPFIVPRNLDAALPFISLLAAAALVSLAERVPRDVARRVTLVVLGCAISAYGATLSWRLTPERSGFAQAARYVEHHGGKALASNEVMVFYLPGPATGARCDAPGLPNSKPKLAAYRKAGYRYAVLESFDSGFSRFIVRHARRVGHYPAYGPISIGENPVKSENGDPPNPNPVEYIAVYDLGTLALPNPGRAKATECYRNVPI